MTLCRDRQIYSRAPIVEAVIDLRTVNSPGSSVRDLKEIGDSFAGYTQSAELMEIAEVLAPASSSRSQRIVGLAYECTSPRMIAQLRLEGFASSKLAPYERWETFQEHARGLWQRYVEVMKPTILKRVAVRFINRIDTGGPLDDFRPFVRVFPSTPWDLIAPPSGVFLQIRRVLPENRTLVLNQSVIENEAGEVAIVLDFDVFAEQESIFDADAAWNQIEDLHVIVDESFESSITDLVRKQIR